MDIPNLCRENKQIASEVFGYGQEEREPESGKYTT
jgi:hypothetical protein